MIHKKRNLLIMALLWLSLVGILEMPVLSQTSSDVVVSGNFARTTEYSWSSDSSQLTFYNYDLGTSRAPLRVNTDSPGWQSIDVATGNLAAGTSIWPLQPALSAAEQNTMMPSQFVYQSPDGNLFAFAQFPPDMGFYTLAVANRNTAQVVTLDIATSYPSQPGDLTVQWSADSHAVLIAHSRFAGGLRVFHVDMPDFNDLANHTIHEFDTMIDSVSYTTTPAFEDDVLDMSSDGQFVLLIARDSSSGETTTFYDNPPQLVIWNPYTGYADVVESTIVVEQFLKGSFAPGDDGKLLLTNSQGVFMHNLVTGQTALIRNDFDAFNARYHFSPNGEWLAVVTGEEIRFLSIPANIPPSDPALIVTNFNLVDGDTSTILGLLDDGATINTAAIDTDNLIIRANTLPNTVGSVIFDLDGTLNVQMENAIPYDLTSWTPSPNSYTLTATPYSGAGGIGIAGAPLTIAFTIVDVAASNDSLEQYAQP